MFCVRLLGENKNYFHVCPSIWFGNKQRAVTGFELFMLVFVPVRRTCRHSVHSGEVLGYALSRDIQKLEEAKFRRSSIGALRAQ